MVLFCLLILLNQSKYLLQKHPTNQPMKFFYTISSKNLWNFRTFYNIHLIRCTYCYKVSWTVKGVGKNLAKNSLAYQFAKTKWAVIKWIKSSPLYQSTNDNFHIYIFFMCPCSHSLPSKYLMCPYLVSLKSYLLLWHTDIYFWQWRCFQVQLFPQPSVAIRKNGVKVITKILTRWVSPND